MQRTSYYIINAITLYRLVAAIPLLYFIWIRQVEIFKWLLAVSFFTDAIDGWLSRKYNTASPAGAKLDSAADDMTILVALVGIATFQPSFLRLNWIPVAIMTLLLLIQLSLALSRYGRPTSFHTWLAKMATISQAAFLLLFFFLPHLPVGLFYFAAAMTTLDLLEEIIMVLILPEWKADIKGIWWIYRSK